MIVYEMDDLEWHEVRGFFEANGCVVVDSPELRWYQESWGALRRSDLTDTSEFEEDDPAGTMPKLRALCLLYMYLGMYQAAGEDKYYFEHPSVSSYLHSLGVDLEDIWKLAHRRGMLKTDYRNYSDDDQTDDEDLYDIATQIVSDQNNATYRVLEKHYGGDTALLVSLRNSRLPLDEVEHSPNVEIRDFPGHCQQDVWEYVIDGMRGWRWS